MSIEKHKIYPTLSINYFFYTINISKDKNKFASVCKSFQLSLPFLYNSPQKKSTFILNQSIESVKSDNS